MLWTKNNFCSPTLATRMVAVPATKAFGKDRTGGAALLRGRGGAHLGFKDI